ncbi:MAG: hypothetical protein JWN48_4485 [Myxococcaceae bacterium]|nr:hypothetical protein [Myxococcaceae bacterium]
MRSSACILCALSLSTGCKSDVKTVPATEVVARIEAAPAVLRAMASLRVRTSGEQDGTWVNRNDVMFASGELTWPVDIVVAPRSEAQASSYFELVIEALDADQNVLVQTRALSPYVLRQSRVLALSLDPCGSHPLGYVCEPNPSCQGPDCLTCLGAGCGKTPLVPRDGLLPLQSDAAVDERTDQALDAGKPDGAALADSTPDAADGLWTEDAAHGPRIDDPDVTPHDAGTATTDANAIPPDAGTTGHDAAVCPNANNPVCNPPASYRMQFNVQPSFDSITAAPGEVASVAVKLNDQPCSAGACTLRVQAAETVTVQVSLGITPGAGELRPVLRSWDGCTASASSFEAVVHDDQSQTISWVSTFSDVHSDQSCTANFAQAASLWFHLPINGPSTAQAAPAQFCDHSVNPMTAAQIAPGLESWNTICLLPPSTTVTLTPFYQGRQLSEMVCLLKERPSAAFVKTSYTSTPVVIPGVKSGQSYECALDKPPP